MKMRIDISRKGLEIRELPIVQDLELSGLSKILAEDYIVGAKDSEAGRYEIEWLNSGITVFAKSGESYSKINDLVEIQLGNRRSDQFPVEVYFEGVEIPLVSQENQDFRMKINNILTRPSESNRSEGSTDWYFFDNGCWRISAYDIEESRRPRPFVLLELLDSKLGNYRFRYFPTGDSIFICSLPEPQSQDVHGSALTPNTEKEQGLNQGLSSGGAFKKGLWEYFGKVAGILLIAGSVLVALLLLVFWLLAKLSG